MKGSESVEKGKPEAMNSDEISEDVISEDVPLEVLFCGSLGIVAFWAGAARQSHPGLKSASYVAVLAKIKRGV